MGSEGKFFVALWAFALAAVIALISGVTYYNVNNTNKITEMVKGGANPIEAACALRGYDSSTCTLRAVK